MTARFGSFVRYGTLGCNHHKIAVVVITVVVGQLHASFVVPID